MTNWSRIASIDDLRSLARHRLPRVVFDFIDGGAEDETTLNDNRTAYDRWKFRPRAFVDVSHVSAEVNLFGNRIPYPLAISPTGMAGMVWPHAEVALARAAADFGIPFTLSTLSMSKLETVAREAGGRLWFQVYIFRDREYTMKLIDRARNAGYEALVVTGDVPVGGKRDRDVRNGFSVPLRRRFRDIADVFRHPAWWWQIATHGLPKLENIADWTPSQAGAPTHAAMMAAGFDPSVDWDTVRRMRDAWPGKFIVKGVLTAEDTEAAVALGADGVIVSNHGGRQLDGAIASLDALPEVVRAANGKLAVLLDGGIRRGTDVLKALSLGATAAMTGRGVLYGVAAAGEPGARHALSTLTSEITRSMALLGRTSVRDLNAELLTKTSE
jgi:(S)-mandelate dehydrogenase